MLEACSNTQKACLSGLPVASGVPGGMLGDSARFIVVGGSMVTGQCHRGAEILCEAWL